LEGLGSHIERRPRINREQRNNGGGGFGGVAKEEWSWEKGKERGTLKALKTLESSGKETEGEKGKGGGQR